MKTKLKSSSSFEIVNSNETSIFSVSEAGSVTINGESILGSGDINSSGGSSIVINGNTAEAYAAYGGLPALIQKYNAAIIEVEYNDGSGTTHFSTIINNNYIESRQNMILTTDSNIIHYIFDISAHSTSDVIMLSLQIIDITNHDYAAESDLESLVTYYQTPVITKVVFF